TPIYGYRRTENRRVHYEEMSRWPARLLIVGDAACAFNPIYGQGMTAAALGARALDEHLQSRQAWTGEWGLRFQQALAKVNDATWLLATGEDFRWPETEGVRPARNDRLVQRYVEQVTRVAANDAVVNQAFAEVLHLVKPPVSLFHPRVVWRVLRRWRN
ncbi:MAG TPA: hypothetical protein VNK95_11565, partial [Caldilineaceae bacterium]|nr:hypothetical protein [Caldilineaceae bacterium]